MQRTIQSMASTKYLERECSLTGLFLRFKEHVCLRTKLHGSVIIPRLLHAFFFGNRCAGPRQRCEWATNPTLILSW